MKMSTEQRRQGHLELCRLSLLPRGIVKAMGLTGKISPDQVAKKWDNLKSKFKVTLSRDDTRLHGWRGFS